MDSVVVYWHAVVKRRGPPKLKPRGRLGERGVEYGDLIRHIWRRMEDHDLRVRGATKCVACGDLKGVGERRRE